MSHGGAGITGWTQWKASDNIDYIQMLRKLQHDERFKNEDLRRGRPYMWMPKDEKIKWGKFCMSWEGPYKVGKVYNNNII